MASSLSLVCVTWCFCFLRIRNFWDFNFSKYVSCLLLSAAGDSIKTISWCAPKLYSHNRERGGGEEVELGTERWLRATSGSLMAVFIWVLRSPMLMETSTRYTLHCLHSYLLPSSRLLLDNYADEPSVKSNNFHHLYCFLTIYINFIVIRYVYFTYLRFDLCGQMMNDNWQETSWYFNWIGLIHWWLIRHPML